jgi:hypothetical protein
VPAHVLECQRVVCPVLCGSRRRVTQKTRPPSARATTRNAHARTGTGAYGAEGFHSTAQTRPAAPVSLEPRTDAPRASASRSPERTRPKACFYAPSEQRRTDRSPRRLPRARSPQAPGRSSQSSADVGVLRGRSRTPRDAEYVTSPPRPHRRARPEPARFRCQVSRPIPTVRDSTVCYPRVRNGFFASEGHFFLGPRVAERAQTLPTRARAGRRVRERTADRLVEAPTYVLADRPAPVGPPRARARARSPRTPVRDATSARRDAIELFRTSVSSFLTPPPPSTDPPFSNPSYVSSTQSSPRTVAAKPRRAAGWRPWRAASPP